MPVANEFDTARREGYVINGDNREVEVLSVTENGRTWREPVRAFVTTEKNDQGEEVVITVFYPVIED